MQEDLPSICKHAAIHGIVPLKKYGQNFIFDATLCDRIVKASNIGAESNVLEIGPGTAGLTRSIISRMPRKFTIVEMDLRCVSLLEEVRSSLYPNLHIIQGDGLEFCVGSLFHDNQTKISIVSNLPYQVGTALVLKWLKNIEYIDSITVMLQKEVVDRMRSPHGSKLYGRLSVICQLICQVKKCFDVGSQAFYPSPKVESSIVKLIPLESVVKSDVVEAVELITKMAFGERRKMIRSSLKNLNPNILGWFKELDLDPTCRAENLSVKDYTSLAKLYITSTVRLQKDSGNQLS